MGLDEKGWPRTFDPPADGVEVAAAITREPQTPQKVKSDSHKAAEQPSPLIRTCTPNYRKRKLNTKAARSAKKTRAPVASAHSSLPECAQLTSVYASTTDEKKPRCEVRGVVLLPDGSKKRLHVFTFTRSAHGPTFAKKGHALKRHIDATGCCKRDALKFVAGLI